MNLAGTVCIGNEQYFLFMKSNAGSEFYSLYSPIAFSDKIRLLSGDKLKYPKISNSQELLTLDSQNYFIGAISKSLKTGEIKTTGDVNYLTVILDAIRDARYFKFDSEEIITDTKDTVMGKIIECFSAECDELKFYYSRENKQFTGLLLNNGHINIQLKQVLRIPGLVVKLQPTTNAVQKQISKAIIEKITFDDLMQVLDMSWYKDSSGVKKDYRVVKSMTDFETMFAEMMDAAQESYSKGEELVVALDTETTGTMIFELSKGNPALDHCVAISISWKEDQAYIIFNDMEYFTNVSAEYCFSRLAEVFTESRDYQKTHWISQGVKKEWTFKRDVFRLVGQNFPFDRRVSMGEGHALWFDDDTLNMAFNINPKTVRGNNGLKNLTRRLFHHETPELSDVLGKGNEDKYRYLADEEVAAIYAGADADYTRKCFFKLKELLGERMYCMYNKQDVRMLNILAKSEYQGLTTDESGVKALAEVAAKDLQTLREAAYQYVGAYMDFNQEASICDVQFSSGLLTEEEYKQQLEKIEPDPEARYEFEFKGADIRDVMFNILKYPVIAKTDTGLAKTDKYTRKKLLEVGRKENSNARKLQKSILVYGADYKEYQRLKNGSPSDQKKAHSMELIDMDVFNSKEYPLALIFEKYADLNKEYTSYFEPILRDNLEGRLFKTYSLSRIETRRIMNASQTMKKRLKKLIIPYNEDYYHLDFDLSQIELRLMYSLSPSPELIEKMKNPEADGHTENAAMVNQKEPYKVTKKERKAAKSVSFGVPYGLGDRSLCETMFGDKSDEHLFETRMVLYKWKQANAPIVKLLEGARDQALSVVEISDDKRDFMDAWKKDSETKEYLLDENGNKIPIPLGAVYNKLGFCRYFDLSDIDQSPEAKARRATGKFTAEESKIRRAAGNYPIQSYAAEFFRTILYRFYDRCEKEGIQDKVVWHMLIHDELLCSVHKSVNPILMYKIVKEACMITMPGHTKYYVGVNIGDNWEQTKDDDREAPVIFLDRMVKRYDAGEFREQTWFDHPWDFIKPYREKYIRDRIYEEIKKLQPTLDSEPINIRYIIDNFANYTVKAYVNDYPINTPIDDSLRGDAKDDAIYASKFESWMIDYFGEGKQLLDLDGKIKVVSKFTGKVKQIAADDEDFIDFDDYLEDGELYDFDTDSLIETYLDDAEDLSGSTLDDVSFDYSRTERCSDVAQMEVFESKYKHLKILNGCIIIKVANDVQEQFIRSRISTGKGNLIMFKTGNKPQKVWQRASDAIDLLELDAMIESVSNIPAGLTVLNDRIIVQVRKQSDKVRVMKAINDNKGAGYRVFMKDALNNVTPIGQIKADSNFAEFIS